VMHSLRVLLPLPAWANILKCLFCGLTVMRVKDYPELLDVVAAVKELNSQIQEEMSDGDGI